MHYVLSISIALMLLVALPTQAQTGGDAPNNALLANVDFTETTLNREGREILLSFALNNAGGVQTGVRYGVMLVPGEKNQRTTEDTFVYDEVLTLLDGDTVTRNVVYTAPSALEGDYTVYLITKSESGFTFAMKEVGKTILQKSGAALLLDGGNCYLTVDPSGARLDANKIASLAEGDSLVSHCEVTNTEPGLVTITPWYETRSGSLFGASVIAEGGSGESVTFEANETKTLVTPLPKMNKEGEYAVTVAYDAQGNDVTYMYTVGTPARVENIILDQYVYRPGDQAMIGVVARGPEGMYTLTLEVTNSEGVACGAPVFQAIELDGTSRTNVLVPITSSCTAPSVSVQLTDNTNTPQMGMVANVVPPARPAIIPEMMQTNEELPFDFGPSFFISVIALAAGLGVYYHSLYKKGKINMPKAPLMLLAMFAVWSMFGGTPAEAATFTQNGGACTVSISLDPASAQIRTGQSILVYGYTSCPGLTITGTLANAGTGVSVTANSAGGISGSFPAPAADDTIQWVSGDPGSDPFGLGNPTYPWDLIMVNRCLPQVINNCSTPEGDLFGAPVGSSGGTCGGGGTGSCSYTCQSDLTWRVNSNTCTPPPPPPPGSTPEFSTTPSCLIAANGASCTATVGVFVPSTYMWGADLKTCSGTYIQTIPPGNHTVSVVVPYDTACLNLHPWSFLPTPAVDTVTAHAACTPGSSWNGSICAPLPTPGVPTGVTAQTWGSCGAKTIKLMWENVSGATRYDVERDGVLISSVANPFIDTVTVDGVTHVYRVRAWNGSGPSAWSDPVSGTAPSACAVASGSFTIGTCAIQAGQSTCNASIAWTTTGAISPNVLQGGTSFSTAPSSPSTPRPVGYGNTVFTLQDASTLLDEDTVSIGCVSGTVWNGTLCEVPTPPPSTRPCGATEILGCPLNTTPHGGVSGGACNAGTHTGTCSYTCNDGSWSTPSTNSCTPIVVPPPVVTGAPVLTASSRLVRMGTSVTIQWDTNNGNENLCSLTGGALGTSQNPIPFNASDPSGEEGGVTQVISGRTTFTLSCPASGSASVTIDVIPEDSET